MPPAVATPPGDRPPASRQPAVAAVRRNVVLAIVVVIVAAAVIAAWQPIADWLGGDRGTIDYSGAEPLDVDFTVRSFDELTVADDLTCAEATSPENAYAAYLAVGESLTADADPEGIPYLDCFLPGVEAGEPAQAVRARFVGEVFDADVLYGYLERAFEQSLLRAIGEGNLRHGGLAWGSGNLGNIALLAYQRTRQERFIDLYLAYFERVMAMRDSVLDFHDDYHDRVMDAWGSANLGRNAGDPEIWVAHVTHFSIVMLPATGFARLIRDDPALSRYEDFADEVVAFFGPAYRQFDVDLKPAAGTDEVWFWRPLVDKFEATNHLHLQGQTLLNMYALTGDPFYAERIRWIIRVFEVGVMLDDDGLAAWNYHPYLQVPESKDDSNARGYSEFVWKAALTVPFLYQAEHQGFAIDPEIMAATTKTIREHVVADNDYAQNFHPKGSRPIADRIKKTDSTSPPGSIAGFLPAAIDDPGIATQIRTIVATRPDLYPTGWFLSDELVAGYAYFLESD